MHEDQTAIDMDNLAGILAGISQSISLDVPEGTHDLDDQQLLAAARRVWPEAILVDISDPGYPIRIFRDRDNAEYWVAENGGRIIEPAVAAA